MEPPAFRPFQPMPEDPTSPKAKRQAPVKYSPKLAAAVCERIAAGESLRAVCAEPGMPSFQAFLRWTADNRDGLRALYSIALDMRAQYFADEIVELADRVEIGTRTKVRTDGVVEQITGDMVERSRLRVDARKWVASRLAPKRYGDRLSQEISGPDGGPIELESSRPSPEEVTAFARELHDGFHGWRDEQTGEAATFGTHQAGAFAEVIASFAAGSENPRKRTGTETGAFLARLQAIDAKLRREMGIDQDADTPGS